MTQPCRTTQYLIVGVTLLGALLMPYTRVGALLPRQWAVALTGPAQVSAGHEYTYTLTLSNDGGTWPLSASGDRRLLIDLRERFAETTVGIEDILVRPTGAQRSDGAFPCEVTRGCWFIRSGPRIDLRFTAADAVVPPLPFDIVVRTGALLRPGNQFVIAAALGRGSSDPPLENAMPTADASALAQTTLVAIYPQPCATDGEMQAVPGETSGSCFAA